MVTVQQIFADLDEWAARAEAGEDAADRVSDFDSLDSVDRRRREREDRDAYGSGSDAGAGEEHDN